MTDFNKRLGSTLRLARQRAGLKQREVALRMDASRQRVSKHERGVDAMNVETLCRYCKVIGTTPEEVLNDARS